MGPLLGKDRNRQPPLMLWPKKAYDLNNSKNGVMTWAFPTDPWVKKTTQGTTFGNRECPLFCKKNISRLSLSIHYLTPPTLGSLVFAPCINQMQTRFRHEGLLTPFYIILGWTHSSYGVTSGPRHLMHQPNFPKPKHLSCKQTGRSTMRSFRENKNHFFYARFGFYTTLCKLKGG